MCNHTWNAEVMVPFLCDICRTQWHPSGSQRAHWFRRTQQGSREVPHRRVAKNLPTKGLHLLQDQLSGSAASFNDCSKANLGKLVEIANELLGAKVSRVDLETGRNVEVHAGGTNMEQLAEFAQLLSDERRRRSSSVNVPYTN